VRREREFTPAPVDLSGNGLKSCAILASGRSYCGLGGKLKHAAERRAASGSSSSCRRMRGSLGGGLEDGGLANRLQRPEQAASFSGHSD
jgi:hypothetical protein